MAISRIKIDYTVYPPGFRPGIDACWDFRTFVRAKGRARALGPGARVYRNFNEWNKGNKMGDWWGDKRFWIWTGSEFKRLPEAFQQVGKEWLLQTSSED